jgi:hypothetical protein
MKDKKQTTVEIDKQIIDDLLLRIDEHRLNEADYELIKALICTVININSELEKRIYHFIGKKQYAE